MAAFAAIGSASARKVKISVDMTGQTVSANGVHVTGDLKTVNGVVVNPSLVDWDPSTNAMTNGGSGNIYSVTLDMAANLVYEYKFINGNTWDDAENIPAASQVGGGNSNRWQWVGAGTDTLKMAAIKFSGTAPAGKYLVRLKCDMALAGTVDSTGVNAAGSFQGWSPAKADSSRMVNYSGDGKFNSTVYQGLFYVAAGSYEFKFVKGTGGWESPSGACVNGGGNRNFAITTADYIGEIVCYAKCAACVVVPKYNITFNVDMASICGVDSADVAGGLLDGSWGAGNKMTKVGTTDKYTGTQLSIDSGSLVAYKYRYYKGGKQNWEQILSGSGNRELLIKGDTVLAANCFSTFGPCNTRPAPQDITFKVDISKITPNGNIYLVLDYLGDKTSALRMTQKAGFPAVYEKTVTGVCNGTIYYYFINGDSSVDANKENFSDSTDRGCVKPNGVGGYNRELVRTTATPITIFKYFGSCKSSTTSLFEANALSANLRLYPNPTNTYTVVEFNDNANSHTINVMDIAGRLVRTYSDYKLSTLKIDKDDLTPGIYFVNVTNDRNQNGSIKLLID